MIKISSLYLLLASCATVYATSTSAGTPCPTTPTSLATYIRDYAVSGCDVGVVDYTNFQFLDPSSSGVPAPTAEQVYLTPVGLGFAFTYGSSPTTPVIVPAGEGNNSNFTVQYDFDPPPALGDATEILDPPLGDVAVTEQICPGGTFTGTNGPGTCMIGPSDHDPVILVVYNPGQLQDTEPLGVSNGEVNLSFFLAGDQGPASFDSLESNFDLAPTGAPEPATTTLFLMGGVLLITGLKGTAGRKQRLR